MIYIINNYEIEIFTTEDEFLRRKEEIESYGNDDISESCAVFDTTN